MKIHITLLFIFSVATGSSQEMTPERFRQIVAMPGDNVSLSARLTAGAPIWTNYVSHVVLKYEAGKSFTNDLPITVKTVSGKFVVSSAQSKLHPQPLFSIYAYDEKSAELKIYMLHAETVAEETVIPDPKRKTYVKRGVFADGFTEISTGTYSDSENSSRTWTYKNGVLFRTRDATSRPVSAAK